MLLAKERESYQFLHHFDEKLENYNNFRVYR